MYSKLQIPILFMVFNRLDTTKRVFESIRQAKPARLYIGADGARKNKKGELEKVDEVRKYITNHIDWDCEVYTLFRDNNLGCRTAVIEAINWFFEHESQGIILEDDCLPSQSFFQFCEEMLNRYKNDKRIWHISGDNFQNGIKRGDGDYYFSRYTHIWGWATWADRWQKYDADLTTLPIFKQQKIIQNIFDDKNEQRFWLDVFDKIYQKKFTTCWDYQWSYCAFVNNGLSILPNVNLISNIGFGAEATHTVNLDLTVANLKFHDFNFPIQHPIFMVEDMKADKITAKNSFTKKTLSQRAINKVMRKILNKEYL